MTNGDVGHFEQAGGPLAQRRKAEVAECARILGLESEVLDIHDGELVPSLENRKKITRLIREWQADIVMSHRPYDYHPDHRYTGVLVKDTAGRRGAVLRARHAADPLPGLHVLLRRLPGSETVHADVVVGIDAVADKKWKCISAMPSQFGDKDRGRSQLPNVPPDDRERESDLLDIVKKRDIAVAEQYRERLIALYGPSGARDSGRRGLRAESIRPAAVLDELKQMFPIQ